MSIPQQSPSISAQDQAPYDPTNSRYVVIQHDGKLSDIMADDPGLRDSVNASSTSEVVTTNTDKNDSSSSSTEEKGNNNIFSSLGHFFSPIAALWHRLVDKKPAEKENEKENSSQASTPQTETLTTQSSTIPAASTKTETAPAAALPPKEAAVKSNPSVTNPVAPPAVDPTPRPHSEALHKYHNYETLPTPTALKTPAIGTSPTTLNNPGNLRFNGDAWVGMIVPLDRKLTAADYLAFDTIEHGLRAMAINLRNQQDLGHKNTIESIIATYAPKTDGNQTETYINHVSEWMSQTLNKEIKRNTALDLHDTATLDAFMKAVVRQENGVKNPYSDKLILAAVYDALEPSATGAKTVVASGIKPSTFTSVPADHAGVLKVLQSFVNPKDPVDLEHLDPEFAKDLAAKCIAMSKLDGSKYNGQFYILSTYRDEAKQAKLYEQAKIYVKGKWTGELTHPVAKPGHSAHQGGEIDGKAIAADFQFAGDAKYADAFYRDVVRKDLGSVGLESVPNDPNHVQLKGAAEVVAERIAHETKPETKPVVVAAAAPQPAAAPQARRAARTALRHDSVLVADAEPTPKDRKPANIKAEPPKKADLN